MANKTSASLIPLRYLILTWEIYPLYMGGLGVLTSSVCKELISQGHQVTVVVPHEVSGIDFEVPVISLYDKIQPVYNKKQDIKGLEEELVFRKPKKKKQTVVWPAIFSESKNTQNSNIGYRHDLYPLDVVKTIRAFGWACSEWLETNQQHFDFIIAMDWHTQPVYFAASNFLQIPFVPYINSTLMDREPNPLNRPKSIYSVEQKSLSLAQKIVTISNMEKQVMVSDYGVDPEKILVVNNDLEFDASPEGYVDIKKAKNVLFIGRIFPQKGLDFLVETAARVVNADSSVRFIIAGDGIIVPEIMEKVAILGLERNVIFTGWISMEEKKKLYSSCDIFVMPSPFEPFGLTALEAIKSGVPVIASNNCGFLGVVPSTPTFAYYQIGDFTNKLMFYLNNPSQSQKLLQLQQKDLAKHSWSSEVAKFIKLSRQLTNK